MAAPTPANPPPRMTTRGRRLWSFSVLFGISGSRVRTVERRTVIPCGRSQCLGYDASDAREIARRTSATVALDDLDGRTEARCLRLRPEQMVCRLDVHIRFGHRGNASPRAGLLSSSRQDDVPGLRRCDDPPRSA